MRIPVAGRMQHFESGIFAELAGMKRQLEAEGRKVIDLSIGSPDSAPPQHVRRTLSERALDEKSYGYTLGDIPELREAAAGWYRRRYGVALDADREVLSLYGAEDGLVHFCLAVADPGDTVLVPDPYFPAFLTGVHLAGATPVFMPLREENEFLIDFGAIPEETARRAKLMIVSYPNNPTSAVAPDAFYRELIEFARVYEIIVLHDNAYSDLVYDGPPGKSFLAFDGAKEVGVELNSLSKPYSLAGARLAFCVGNAELIRLFARLKSNLDLGSFLPTQHAAIAAISGDQSCVALLREHYRRRRDVLSGALSEIGWHAAPCHATLFLWARLPGGRKDDRVFVRELLEQSGVLLSPGSAFGEQGSGYVRFSLMQNEDTLRAAASAIADSALLR